MAGEGKNDRSLRLLRVIYLLSQITGGMSPRKIAETCHVSLRTSYRDLAALAQEMNVPVWADHGNYGIEPDYFLPPLKLTLQEAMALFLSARLLTRYSDESDPNMESAFIKLGFVLPEPIAIHIKETMVTMSKKRENKDLVRVFQAITNAWARNQRVLIRYPRPGPDDQVQEFSERFLDPYFIEPSSIGHSCYVIGFDHLSREIRTFKIENILAVETTEETFEVPDHWNAHDYLHGSLGIVHNDDVTITIRFSKRVASRVKESVWHETQRLRDEVGGTLLFTVQVAGTMEIVPWLLSWGPEAEVLSPPALRREFAAMALHQAEVYGTDFLGTAVPEFQLQLQL